MLQLQRIDALDLLQPVEREQRLIVPPMPDVGRVTPIRLGYPGAETWEVVVVGESGVGDGAGFAPPLRTFFSAIASTSA